MLRSNRLARNGMVTVRALIGRMLGAPVSRSAYGRGGAGCAGRLQAPTPQGLAVVPVGVGSPARPANGLRGPLRPRVRPVASRRGAGGRQVPRVRGSRARLRADPLRRLCPRIPVGLLLQVPVLLPELSRQALGDLDAVAGHHTARTRAASASRPHDPETTARLLFVSSPPPRRDRPRGRPHGHGRDPL